MPIISFYVDGTVVSSMDTNQAVAMKGVINPPQTPPAVNLQDKLVSGNLQAQVADSARNTIVWKDKEVTLGTWPMDDADAVEAGLNNIFNAIDADTSITIGTDGEEVNVS